MCVCIIYRIVPQWRCQTAYVSYVTSFIRDAFVLAPSCVSHSWPSGRNDTSCSHPESPRRTHRIWRGAKTEPRPSTLASASGKILGWNQQLAKWSSCRYLPGEENLWRTQWLGGRKSAVKVRRFFFLPRFRNSEQERVKSRGSRPRQPTMLLLVPLWQMTCLELQRCHQTQDRLWHQEARNGRNRWSDRHIPGIIDTIPWFDLAGCYSHYQSTALDPFCICLHLFGQPSPSTFYGAKSQRWVHWSGPFLVEQDMNPQTVPAKVSRSECQMKQGWNPPIYIYIFFFIEPLFIYYIVILY